MPIWWLEVRSHDTAPSGDVHLIESLHDRIARERGIGAKCDLIGLPIRQQARGDIRWDQGRMAREPSPVTIGDRTSTRKDVVQPIKLSESDRSLDICDAIVVANLRISFEHGRRHGVTGKV